MFSTHRWGQICFYTVFSVIAYLHVLADSAEGGQLTVCGPPSDEKLPPRSLLFVSTLDGKVSALNAADYGKKQWTLDFKDGPMLSSSIHRRELNNNGQWVRLIPSLSGGLYKFDGETLEAIPVSTDQLLYSSFRYSDDLVLSGGKETRSYGVSTTTGKVLYECSISGCTNNTDGETYIEQEIIVVQRFQQTVRAVEPRSGIERWNFSVGQHDLVLMPSTNVGCSKRTTDSLIDIEIKVIVPEGLIWAVNRSNPAVTLWQYKFDTPIVTIWREDGSGITDENGGLKRVNLFNNLQWEWGSEFSVSPSIYLGMHDRQLYVQENVEIQRSLEVPKYLQESRYPWQPYPAVGNAVVHFLSNALQTTNNNDVSLEENEAQSTTALSVLYNSEYINGNGFYLYSKSQLGNDTDNMQCNSSKPNVIRAAETQNPPTANFTTEDDTPVQIIIVSLWYWWKEVLIISFTTAILLNFMLTQRLLNATAGAKDAVLPPLIVERPIEIKNAERQASDESENVHTFKSRYLADFEPVDCLGKGGYGIVFEAKNKIDDCNYAIKRIALPNSEESRERVMREVKALAKLDHHNIVRYFHAWLECPPAGWQEEHDKQWIEKQKLLAEYGSDLSQSENKLGNSVCIDVTQTDQSSVDSACEAYELNHNDNSEDSFIVFEHSEKNRDDNETIDISESSTESSQVSLSSNGVEADIFDDSNASQSIVFQENTTEEVSSEKEKVRQQKALFALNLNNKTAIRKSAKMFLYIQMQLCQRLSLREWLKQKWSLRDSRRVLDIFHQIVDAVEYVHLQGLIHRDLKPSNIFFAFDNTIKIGDFGLVTAMTEGYDEAHTPGEQGQNITLKNSLHTACVGTHLYMSPEQLNGQIYNYKVDIYSLGIIFFELLIPFATEMERVIALMNLKKSIFPKDFDKSYPSEYELLKMMLDSNPDKRPTTLGIKARPPLLTYNTANGYNGNGNSMWHFELPQLTRHSSVASNSSSESWENVS